MQNNARVEVRKKTYKCFVFGNEKKVLLKKDLINAWKNNITDLDLGIYVHIPFCSNVCLFCDCYTENISKQKLDAYLINLNKQIKQFSPLFKNKKVSTLYFGGGTPSILSNKQLEQTLKILYESYDLRETHFSFEASPASFSKDKINILKNYNVNRITIGIQSFDKKVLKLNNRQFVDIKIIKELVKYSQNNNIRVNLELIAGIAGQDKKSFLRDLCLIEKINPDQINIYDLIINDVTLSKRLDYLKYNDFKNDREIIKKISEIRKKYKKTVLNEMVKDDVSKNKQIHNTRFLNHSLLGLGDGAISKIDKDHIYATTYANNKIKYYYSTKEFNEYCELV